MFFARQDTTIRKEEEKIFCVKFRFHSEQLGMPFSSAVSNIFVFFCVEKGKNPPTVLKDRKKHIYVLVHHLTGSLFFLAIYSK